jgi:hypothetical protein
MRKISLILAVLLFAVPAWSEVLITCSIDGDNVVTVSYDASGEPNLVRAFALDIVVSGADITDVNDEVSDYYYIYPGSIEIDGNEVTSWGTIVADSNYPGTLSGPNAMTIEAGALYTPTDDSSPNAPPSSGDLFKFTMDAAGTVTITENEARNGVVLTDPDLDPDVNAPGCGKDECFSSSDPNYQAWLDAGQPQCWCWKRQCHGDADGKAQGNIWAGFWHVGTDDLNVLVAAWQVLEPADPPTPDGPGIGTITGPGPDFVPGICADFARNVQGNIWAGFWYVGTDDLNAFVPWFQVLEPADPPTPSGPGVPVNCGGTLDPP